MLSCRNRTADLSPQPVHEIISIDGGSNGETAVVTAGFRAMIYSYRSRANPQQTGCHPIEQRIVMHRAIRTRTVPMGLPRSFFSAALLLSLLILLPLPTVGAADHDLPPYSRTYDPHRDPFADGRAAIELAGRTGRRVLIAVGGDWCVWCHVLERIFKDDPQVEEALRKAYVLLKVSVDETNDNAEFLRGLPPLTSYPTLFVARGDGMLIHVQDPADFLLQGTYDPSRVLAFLQRWARP